MTHTDVPLDQWQTETKRIPTYQLNEEGKLVVGERVAKQRYMLTTPVPHAFCAAGEHHYSFVDHGRRQHGRVLVKCDHCGLGRVFIPGIHHLEGGQLTAFPHQTSQSTQPTRGGGE